MGKGYSLGGKIRALRHRESLSQVDLAEKLEISPSYLNLIEHDHRPLSATLLIKLTRLFPVDLESFTEETDARLQAQLAEVFGDPLFARGAPPPGEVHELATVYPGLARSVLHLYQGFRSARNSAEALSARLSHHIALPQAPLPDLPADEVSEFIQHHVNHFPDLETAGEELWEQAQLARDDMQHGLVRYLADAHGIRTETCSAAQDGGVLRRFQPAQRTLILSETLPPSSRLFQIAHQIALLAQRPLLEKLTHDEALTTDASRSLGRMALANYFAGAVLMPYADFLRAAREQRYDVDLLGNRFNASFEQVCHRLTAMRRPGPGSPGRPGTPGIHGSPGDSGGIPFHFLRADIAGNISKRFNGSGIAIGHLGGACARWNLHSAFLTPGVVVTQLSQMPDGKTYFCIARTVVRRARTHSAPRVVYAITLGCDVAYAAQIVYADGVNLANPQAVVPIGSTCRLCPRLDCEQRAFPSLDYPLAFDENSRGISFYAPAAAAPAPGIPAPGIPGAPPARAQNRQR